ncbi:anthranilate synthase component I family protein [Perlucidibaca piscinae]|uniref:anthranilate synthase component I family protein n=1 Tax=Perlucidibaca piscinae TaxID=392589 RepID=UPI0003B47630|nr:anthranilate synthase component I family protein [Perlucidibaca piscinae]
MPIRALTYQASPLALFDRFIDWSWPVLLDSQDAGRWDIMTAAPDATATLLANTCWQIEGMPETGFSDAFAALQALSASTSACAQKFEVDLPFSGGVIATLGYAAASERGLPERRHDDWPCAFMARYRWAICTDHDSRQSWLVWQNDIAPDLLERLLVVVDTPPPAASRPAPLRMLAPFSADTDTARYADDIARIHDYIRAGDCYQINYTQSWSAPCEGQGWSAWQALRAAAGAPYSVYWRLPWGEMLSLSPEQFLQVQPRPDGGARILTRPIKGTRRREPDAVADAAEARALRTSGKDLAENVMITDLLRNDLAKHATIGSVRVPELCALHSYGQVHHLVSTIEARLAPGHSPAQLFRDAFPGGSITGAPKKRAMEIIEALEVTARGIYCGSVIMADASGRWDSSITIRTFVIGNGRIRTWAGGGITLDSVWQDEHQECHNKIGGLMRTLESLHDSDDGC